MSSATDQMNTNTLINLDVLGTNLTVSKLILTKITGSKLSDMFNGKENAIKTLEGRYFIERDPKIFKLVVDYLRNDQLSSNII